MSDQAFDDWLTEFIAEDMEGDWEQYNYGLRCPNCHEYWTDRQLKFAWHCHWCHSDFDERESSGVYGDYSRYRKRPKRS